MSTAEVLPPRPEWLDDNFLRSCISADDLNAVDYPINNVELKYAVPKGENFASIMIRVVVNGQKKGLNGNAVDQENNDIEEKRYIVKVGHNDGELKKAMVEFNLFAKEIDMYTNLVPTFHKLLEDSGITNRFACRCLHTELKHDVIVLEDLTPLGYKLEDRIKGLDLQHCQLVYLKLALLHASSMRYLETHSLDTLKSFYGDNFLSYTENEFMSRESITKRVLNLSEDLRSRLGYEKEAEYVKNGLEECYDMIKEAYNVNQGGILNTLLHGDCWINNMMFKNDKNGEGLDVILLDLQISNYNSIAQDFLYFLVTSASIQVIDNHFNDLIEYYIKNLKSALLKLGYKRPIPTVEQLKDEIRDKSALIIFFMALMVPIMKNQMNSEDKSRNEKEVVNIEDMEKIMLQTRRNPIYQNHIFALVDLLRREKLWFKS